MVQSAYRLELHTLFGNEFFYYIYEELLIFSLFFLDLAGIILSSIKFSKDYYANFYEFYITLIILIFIFGLRTNSLNLINFGYSLFFMTYTVDSFIYLFKIIFLILVVLFLFFFKYYSKLIKVYNFEIFFFLGCSILG